MLSVPLITRNPYWLHILILMSIYAVFAVSWDLLSGCAGQLTLGQSFFYGVGAYGAAIINLRLGLPTYACIPLGALVAVGSGLIAGIPALRLRGPFLAIVSLTLPVIAVNIVGSTESFTGGHVGLVGIDRLAGSKLSAYYITLIFMLVSVLIMWKLTDTNSKTVRVGLILRAIREDEITARASGINTTAYKLLAFCVSGLFAGLAGAFYVHYVRVAGTGVLDMGLAFNAVIWTIFGGMGTILGPVLGVFVLQPISEVLRFTAQVRALIFFALIILVLLFMPQGVFPRIQDFIQVSCPRCRVINAIFRKRCRACNYELHGEGKGSHGGHKEHA